MQTPNGRLKFFLGVKNAGGIPAEMLEAILTYPNDLGISHDSRWSEENSKGWNGNRLVAAWERPVHPGSSLILPPLEFLRITNADAVAIPLSLSIRSKNSFASVSFGACFYVSSNVTEPYLVKPVVVGSRLEDMRIGVPMK
jgi:hypothetical protein